MPLLGEFSALMSAVAYSITCTMFTLAGRSYSPVLVNRASMPLGLACIAILHGLTLGQFFPAGVAAERWLWLSGSAIAGMVISFIFNVNAFIRIGPRLATLVGTLGPVLSTVLAWVLLGEVLDAMSLFGIALTLTGIVWVVSENGQHNRATSDGAALVDAATFRQGVWFAVGAALTSAVAILCADQGVSGDFEPLTATFIRLLVASVVVWLVALLRGQVAANLRILAQHAPALRHVMVGSVTGPVIGVSALMIALQRIPVGIATTLSNLIPIFLIPIGYFVFKERITRRAVIGTVIAIAGTALLFL